jgi:hypothetical protein
MYDSKEEKWIWNKNYILGGHEEGYIMGGLPTWYLHPDNEARVKANIDTYDGVF